jgi:hypothetical protein
MKEDINNALKRIDKASKGLAEEMKEKILGEHAATVIETHGELSIDLLRESIENTLNHTDNSMVKLANEAALNYLVEQQAKYRA